ncbi:MAG: hypothetical protein OWV35_02320 [Firmicutes bacterium]|nr:hypothetical protein [Bacillota bacterium]
MADDETRKTEEDPATAEALLGDPDEPLAPEDARILDQLERLAGDRPPVPERMAATWAHVAPDPETVSPPYQERNRPVVRQQLNPLRRRHPEWPEEWYVRVPGTVYTWAAAEIRRLQRDQVPYRLEARPTVQEAEAFAQEQWRRHWLAVQAGRQHAGYPARWLTPDAVINPRRERVFTVASPADAAELARWARRLPAGAIIHRKGVPLPDGPAAGNRALIEEGFDRSAWAVRGEAAPRDHGRDAEDPPEPWWAAEVGARRGPDGTALRQYLLVRPPTAPAPEPAFTVGSYAREVLTSRGEPEAGVTFWRQPIRFQRQADGTVALWHADTLEALRRQLPPTIVLGDRWTPPEAGAFLRHLEAAQAHPASPVAPSRTSGLAQVWQPVLVEPGIWALVQPPGPVPPRPTWTPGPWGRSAPEPTDGVTPWRQPLQFWHNAAGRAVVWEAASLDALRHRLPRSLQLAGAWVPPDPDSLRAQALADRVPPQPAVAGWIRWARTLLVESRDLERDLRRRQAPGAAEAAQVVRRFWDAVSATVGDLVPPDGRLAPSAPQWQDALRQVAAVWDAFPVTPDTQAAVRRLVAATREWAREGAALTRDELGLFIAGRWRGPGPEEPATGTGADAGTVATLDRRERFAARMPNGQWLVWGGEAPPSRTAEQATPAAYRRSLADGVPLRWVQTRLEDTIAAARARAAEAGATVTVVTGFGPDGRPTAAFRPVLAAWKRQLIREEGPQAAGRLIARTLTPATTPEDHARIRASIRRLLTRPEAPDRPAAAPPPPQRELRVSPWGAGQAVVWEPTGPKTGALVGVRPDGTEVRLAGKGVPQDARPIRLQSAGGLWERVQAAKTRWPDAVVLPADLPHALADRLANRYGLVPEQPERPQDLPWHVSVRPDRPAACAWAPQTVVTPETGATGQAYYAVREQAGFLIRKATGGPVQWEAATPAAALHQATSTLARQGFVPLPSGKTIPEPLVAHLTGRDLAHTPERRAPRPVDPFVAFARLPEERQREVLNVVPERARTVVVPASYGLAPRDLARTRGQPVDVLARQYRIAERSIGDYCSQHPELYRSLRPKAEPPQPETPRPPAPRPRLSVS